MDFNNINFEGSDELKKDEPIDFESFEEPQKTDWIDFESSGKITLPDIAKKEKISGPKLGPIIKSAIQTTKKIFQSELPKEDPRRYGIPEKAGEPISTITGKPLPTAEEEAVAGETVMSLLPHAFAAFTRGAIPEALETAIMQPMTKLITGHDYVSPITEAQRVSGERLPKAAQEVMGIPAQMAGIVVPLSVAFKTTDAALKTIGLSAKAMKDTALVDQLTYHIIRGGTAGGIYGGIAEGTVKGMAKDAALFAVLEGVLGTATPVIKKISKSNWYRSFSIKERGLVTEKIAKQYREGMTEADVLRFFGEESETYKKAMIARGIKVVPKKEPIKIDEPIITEPLKPTVKPTTELGRKLQAAIQAEKKPPVIAGLAKRELEIKESATPTLMTTISEEITNLASVKPLPAPMRAFGMREKPIEPTPTEPTAEVAREPVEVEKPMKEVVPEKVEKAEIKEPWEMTKNEYFYGEDQLSQFTPEKWKEQFGSLSYPKSKTIKIYRGAWQDERKHLDPGDWVTLDKKFAKENYASPEGIVLSKEVPLSELMLNMGTSQPGKSELIWKPEVSLEAYTKEGKYEKLADKRKRQIKQAISEGKPVPKEVLAEYPDLKPVKPLLPKPPKAKPPEAVREGIEGEVIPEVKPKVGKEKVEVTPKEKEREMVERDKIAEARKIPAYVRAGDEYWDSAKRKYPNYSDGAIEDELLKFENPDKDIATFGKTYLDTVEKARAWWTKQLEKEEKVEVEIISEGKEIPKAETQQKSDNIEFFSGLPIHKFPKAAKGLAKLYDDYVGLPIWNYLSETLPEKAGKRFELIDRINKGIIFDYRKDPGFVEVRDDTLFKIQQYREEIKELRDALAKFPNAEQIRIAQIIKGGVTATPKRYEKAFEAIKKFQEVEKDLIELGILGKDNRFRQLSRKEIATKFKEIKAIDDKIKVLQKKLEPIIKTNKVVGQVSEDISEEIISTTTDTITGLYETKITKFSELIEGRVKEALLQRGFAEGEATQMIARLKESVIPIEGRKGTLKEIKETVKSVVTKTIIQEIERLKTYTPSMMARARGSIVRDINKEIKKRGEILERIRLHYKMSGKLYLRRAYEKIESEKGFLPKLMGYVSKRPRLIKGYDIRRKDLSYLYRKKLGEIKRAPYLVYKGLSEETHDVFMMQMFNKVAENKNWTISPRQLAVINSGKDEKLILKYKDFKPLPVTDKLGKLSGQLVDPYIWDDLNQAVVVTNDMIKAWDSVLRLWKTGKVVYNPATQCRNMLSNIILADWGGLPPHRVDIYALAAKEMISKGEYWKEAKKTPLLGTEWAGAEIKQFLKDTAKLKEGNMFVRTSETIKGLLDVPGKAYQGIEQFFKLAVFINERKAGRTIKQASFHAEKAIFNYLKIPPAVRWAKRWYSPFITFSSKAIPRFAETVVRKPWKIAKYGIMMLAVEEITRRMYGESEEEVEQEKKVLPDYMRKSVLPGQLSHLRIPYRDKYGRSKYLDLSFILPWGDIAEQWGQSHLVGRPFLPSHPFYISVAEVAFNEILFTGQELTAKDIDVGSEYWKKIGKQFWRQAMPSLAGSYSYNKLMAAYKGEVDWAMRDRSLTEAIFDTFFGLKVRSIDYTESRGRKLKYLRGRINVIKERFEKDYNKILFNPTPDKDWDEKRTIRLFGKMNTQIDRILERITEIESESSNKTSLKSLIPGMIPWKTKKKPT